MNHRRISALFVAPLLALLMFASTASADVLTSPSGTVYTGAIQAAAEGHVVLDNPIATIECASSLEAEVVVHGNGTNVWASVGSLSFTGCTNSWHVTVASGGMLFLNQTLGSSGEAFSNGMTIEATRFGVTCRYKTEGTTLGEVTSGWPATMEFGLGALIPFHSGSFLCGAGSTSLTGSYKLVAPESLFFDRT